MYLQRKFALLCALLCFTVLFLAGTPSAMLGQATTGTIAGVVTDPTVGTVAGADVTVRNLDTNATHQATTEADGRFSFPGLPVGPYEVTVARAGFSTYKQGPIVLVLNQTAVVNVILKPSGVAETITVTEDAPMLNTTSAEVGARFDRKRLSDLPLSGQFGSGGGFRDVFSVALSAAGVSQTNSGNSNFSTGTNFSVNGSRLRGNNFMIDGQDSNDPSISGRQQQLNNPDLVQEVRLITNQFNAEYGRSAGSVVNVITRTGTNSLHGSLFWFHNDNHLNSCSNTEKAAGLLKKESCSTLPGGRLGAPFRIENQIGGTAGGPIWKDHTFFFGSLQRWTDRQLGSGFTLSGAPSEAGRKVLQDQAGSRPQVAALLKFVPAGVPDPKQNATFTTGGQTFNVPLSNLTSSTGLKFDNWQWSGRIDHRWTKHDLGGRFLFNDQTQSGSGQVTPPGLTTVSPSRSQAITLFLTSQLTSHLLNDGRIAYQRFSQASKSQDPSSESIPSIEITELGIKGFNAGPNRTAFGLAVNLPQFRFNNTYQIQDSMTWNHGSHTMKWGFDFRRVEVKSFFLPTLRGLLRYATLNDFVNDFAEAANINKTLPGGSTLQYYKWYDYFGFVQDTWQVRPSFTLNYGLRYETPGNAVSSLYPVSDNIAAANGNLDVLRLTPRPGRDTNNFQPRFGFSWNPRKDTGLLGHITGGNKLVIRGGYSRTNDYTFINIALNVASSFPFVGAISNSKLQNAFTVLPAQKVDLSKPATLQTLTRTVVGSDFRAPLSEQFALEVQRELATNTVMKIGYVGTKGTGLFQTLDGNPRTRCPLRPTFDKAGKLNGTVPCPRVDATRGVIRLRANSASSIYHSLQTSLDKRLANGLSAGAHYTWSAFIDDASEVFNPSTGEIAVSQDFFNRRSDRGRSTYDRPHRFSANFVWELPVHRSQQGFVGHVLGGWQIGSFMTFQSGSPFTILNGSDPANVDAGIDTLVGNPIRPNLNTNLNISKMSLAEIRAAGGSKLFTLLTPESVLAGGPRVGNVGRNAVRGDKLKNIDFSISKSTKIRERHTLQFRVEMFNLTNTRNFGIPNGDANAASSFLIDHNTNGGNRRIFFGLRYAF